jgi:hypothetical protein
MATLQLNPLLLPTPQAGESRQQRLELEPLLHHAGELQKLTIMSSCLPQKGGFRASAFAATAL